MPSASLTRRGPAVALALLIVAVAVGTLVYPTYPNYDSYYSLLWGREALHLHLPTFDVYRAPTEHPLALLFGAALSLLGRNGDRVMVLATMASLVVLAMGMYRLGRAAFTPVIGLIAGALLLSRFDFPFLAARAYIDIPYLAFVVWAAALEVERPRRGMPVLILLFLASLMRPEAWLMAGLYVLWIGWRASWPDRLRYAAVAAAGPLIWVAVDTIVTGHPLFSLTHTNGLAEELGRNQGLSQVPSATWEFLKSLDKLPVLLAAAVGVLMAIWLTPRRAILPAFLLVLGLATFFMVGVAGLSIINRYLLVPALMIMIFAAVALGGWSMLRPGVVQWLWAGAAVVAVLGGVLYTTSHLKSNVFTENLKFRGDSHRALAHLLDDPKVRSALRCGPLSVPNHKLIPEARWLLKAGKNRVLARSDTATYKHTHRGVALFTIDRTAFVIEQLADPTVPYKIVQRELIPQPGFTRIRTNGYFSAYARC
jgi:hypothetical protein